MNMNQLRSVYSEYMSSDKNLLVETKAAIRAYAKANMEDSIHVQGQLFDMYMDDQRYLFATRKAA